MEKIGKKKNEKARQCLTHLLGLARLCPYFFHLKRMTYHPPQNFLEEKADDTLHAGLTTHHLVFA
jgi:hypothetical protein